MSGEATEPLGPAASLLRSVTRLCGTLLAVLQTRVELLTTEISEDLERGARILMWGMVAVLGALFSLLLAGITLVIYYWDTHRMAAAAGVTAGFVVLSVVAGLAARTRLHEKSRLLDASRTELQRDVAALRGEP
jgi:uncharacterized membrane protein YqjE